MAGKIVLQFSFGLISPVCRSLHEELYVRALAALTAVVPLPRRTAKRADRALAERRRGRQGRESIHVDQ